MAAAIALDRVTSLLVEPGTPVVVQGLVSSAIDGSAFDAASARGGTAGATWLPGGLFDFAAGGLRVVAARAGQHEYVLTASGTPGPACAAAGAESPCLVPRTALLAHQRLRTVDEFLRGSSGVVTVAASAMAPAMPRAVQTSEAPIISMLIIGVLGPLAAWRSARSAFGFVRRRRQRGLARVRRAGAEAVRATRGDLGLRPLRGHIEAIVAEAARLDRSRRAAERELSRIDVAALDTRRRAHARSAGPPSPASAEALRWIAAEREHVERLEANRAASAAGIERIEGALRVMTLRIRELRGVASARARPRESDPVERAVQDLAFRDQARAEVERAFEG